MKELIETFYTAFQNNDAETMATCYHKDVRFEDPAFGELNGQRVGNMWRMFCANKGDRSISFSDILKTGDVVSVRWEAKYTFTRTGRKVHNIIEAEFEFKDGKIIKHTDRFDLHSWAKQALGFNGKLIGGTSFFKKKLNKQTKQLLTRFEKKTLKPVL